MADFSAEDYYSSDPSISGDISSVGTSLQGLDTSLGNLDSLNASLGALDTPATFDYGMGQTPAGVAPDPTGGGYGAPGPYGAGNGFYQPMTNAPAQQPWYQGMLNNAATGGGTGGPGLFGMNPMQMMSIMAGLGLGGASMAGGGGGGSTPKMTPQARQALAQQNAQLQAAQGIAGQMAPSQMGLYNQGAGLLQGMAQGQIPMWATNLIRQANEPYIAQLGSQSIDALRNRGFAGAGPQDVTGGMYGMNDRATQAAYANLPGNMAQQTLNFLPGFANSLMNPGQQAFQNQTGLGQQYGQTGLQMPSGQSYQPSLSQQLGNFAGILGGASQFGNLFGNWNSNNPQQQAQQQPQQQQQQNMAGYQGGRGW